MTDVTDWQAMDDYYWDGPGGWRICRVRADHRWQFELWSGNGTRYGMEATFAAALVLYDRVMAG
jgi:hypothetical protein